MKQLLLRLVCLAISATLGTALAAPPVVKTVPWVPSNLLLPHSAYSGKTVTLKGSSDQEGADVKWFWDFGDGSPVASGTVTDKYVIEARHDYGGAAGTIYTAHLTVQNTATGESASKAYYVQVLNRTLEVEANIAIDEGLWYLHKTMIREGGTPAKGHWRWGSAYGSAASHNFQGITIANLTAFEVNGHLENGDAGNPYVETVSRGMRTLFSWLSSFPIGLQSHGGNPDMNGNGLGIQCNDPWGYYYYQSGMFMDAIVASGTPNAVAQNGGTDVLGRTYKDIVQDMVDAYAAAQYDDPDRGGWRYTFNEYPDNSACQWAAIGMIAAERNWGCVIPAWVKTYNINWLHYSQHAIGQFGYTDPWPVWGPFATTPSGMVQMVMDGIGRGSTGAGYPSWENAETFMRDRFGQGGGPMNDVLDYYYGLFSFVKSMLLHNGAGGPIVMLRSTTPGVADIDWYAAETTKGAPVNGVARTLIDDQNWQGFWEGHNMEGTQFKFETAWAIMMLHQTVIDPGKPVAVARLVPNPAVAGQIISVDGADSYHQDPSHNVLKWEWDLNADGIFESEGPMVTTSFAAVGHYPIKLRITDNSTPPKIVETTATVIITTPPVAPTAEPGGPYHFCATLGKWFLDGRKSVNPDEGQSEPGQPANTIIEYAWELDGDNDFDDAFGATPDVKPFFTAKGMGEGAYLIGLRVTDNTGASYPSSSMGNLANQAFGQLYVDPSCECVTLSAAPALKSVVLTWTTHNDAVSYHVYRSTVSGGPYAMVGETGLLTYKDMAPGPLNATYYYVVRPAKLNGDEICQSNESSAEPLHPAPVATCVPKSVSNTAKYYYTLDASSQSFGHMQLLLYVKDTATGTVQGSIPAGSVLYLRTGVPGYTIKNGSAGIYKYIICSGPIEVWAQDPLGQKSPVINVP